MTTHEQDEAIKKIESIAYSERLYGSLEVSDALFEAIEILETHWELEDE